MTFNLKKLTTGIREAAMSEHKKTIMQEEAKFLEKVGLM